MDNYILNQNILRKKTLNELHQILKSKIISISHLSSLELFNTYQYNIPPPFPEITTEDDDMPPLEGI
jgi:hypothetical protein